MQLRKPLPARKRADCCVAQRRAATQHKAPELVAVCRDCVDSRVSKGTAAATDVQLVQCWQLRERLAQPTIRYAVAPS
eukprot:SAG11_NODE_1268_length_5342_cov_1.710853_5_plen_78_part_00